MNYKRLFIKKELNTLFGPAKRNLLICCALLFIAVFTISFSLGAYEQLKERMDNPYTNWVTMPILYQFRDSIPMLKQHFSNNENLTAYGLKDISDYAKWTMKVVHPKTNKVIDMTGRTMNFEDDITAKIFGKDNITHIKENFNPSEDVNSFELFVSEEFCKYLNINVSDAVGKSLRIKDYEDDFVLIFKIGAVLKNLPNHSTFITSHDFFNMFKENYETTGFVEIQEQTQFNFLSLSQLDHKFIEASLSNVDIIDIDTIHLNMAGAENVYQYTVFTNDYVSDSLKHQFIKNSRSKGVEVTLNKNWKPVSGFSELSNPMYFSFNFANLEKIRELQIFLKEKYLMEIELSVVEDRDNFSLVSKLTYFMIISLIIVAIVSFSIFLVNLIKNHLDKIKPNIGTFMAFGLSSSTIRSIYATTVMKFMLYSWVYVWIVLIIFWIVGVFSGWYSLKLLHPVVIITFLLFNLMSYVLSKRITNNILGETPGDLIYGRV